MFVTLDEKNGKQINLDDLIEKFSLSMGVIEANYRHLHEQDCSTNRPYQESFFVDRSSKRHSGSLNMKETLKKASDELMQFYRHESLSFLLKRIIQHYQKCPDSEDTIEKLASEEINRILAQLRQEIDSYQRNLDLMNQNESDAPTRKIRKNFESNIALRKQKISNYEQHSLARLMEYIELLTACPMKTLEDRMYEQYPAAKSM